jgi:hypothetical protein
VDIYSTRPNLQHVPQIRENIKSRGNTAIEGLYDSLGVKPTNSRKQRETYSEFFQKDLFSEQIKASPENQAPN